MSCATSAYFGSPRGLVSCCKTYSCCSDKGEVGGSSPPRPTINHQCLCGYPHFCPLADCRSKSHLPTICQLSRQADKGAIGTFCVCRLPTPSSRGGRQSTGWESLNTTVGSLHRNKDEPDPSGLQERAPGRTEGPRRALFFTCIGLADGRDRWFEFVLSTIVCIKPQIAAAVVQNGNSSRKA